MNNQNDIISGLSGAEREAFFNGLIGGLLYDIPEEFVIPNNKYIFLKSFDLERFLNKETIQEAAHFFEKHEDHYKNLVQECYSRKMVEKQ
jgi:hypothetical protein